MELISSLSIIGHFGQITKGVLDLEVSDRLVSIADRLLCCLRTVIVVEQRKAA